MCPRVHTWNEACAWYVALASKKMPRLRFDIEDARIVIGCGACAHNTHTTAESWRFAPDRENLAIVHFIGQHTTCGA